MSLESSARRAVDWKMLLALLLLGAIATLLPAGRASSDGGTGASPGPFKVAFVYVGPADDMGWSHSHDQGRLFLDKELGIETAYSETVAEGPQATQAIRSYAEKGYNIIFATSFGYMDSVMEVASQYPNVIFEHATGYKTAGNVGVYDGRGYQGWYLAGIVAGSMTATNVLGYVAPFPIPEVVRNLNAFTLGARSVNPEARVEPVWIFTWVDQAREREAAERLVSLGADVIARESDSTEPDRVAQERGVYAIGYNSYQPEAAPDALLTAPVWNWGSFYKRAVQDVMNGTWSNTPAWWGLTEGILDMAPIAAFVPDKVKTLVEKKKLDIIDGGFDVFVGPIRDNSGAERVPAGATMADQDKLSFDWLVEGVAGKIPAGPATDPWEAAFQAAHGRAPRDQDRADRAWSLDFFAKNGRPPSDAEWLARFKAANARPTESPVEIQVLSVAGWLGQVEPLAVPDVGDVGGAAVLSAYWKTDRAASPHTLLSSGNSVGASIPLSSLFEEEPAIQALNLIGLDADGLGSHDFDRGLAALERLSGLARFPHLSANLDGSEGVLSRVKPFEVFDVAGVKVAVIGITNPADPDLVLPGQFGALKITAPADTATAAKEAARRAGAQLFIAITRLGTARLDPGTGEPSGPLADFARSVEGFDLILGGDSDWPAQLGWTINGALVVQSLPRGRSYARTKLVYDPAAGRVTGRSTELVTPLASGVQPDPEVEAMLAPFRERLASELDRPIGQASEVYPLDSIAERLGEAAIGNLLADALRWRYGTQLAIANSGGLRVPLPSSYRPAGQALRRPGGGYAVGPPHDLVVGDIYALLPFGNLAVTRSVTGEQLYAALENGVSRLPEPSGRFPQISGFRFAYEPAALLGARIVSVTLDDGAPVAADSTTYTLVTNDFMNAGGDGYTSLADGQGAVRERLTTVLVEYIKALGAIAPRTEGRIQAAIDSKL